MRRPRRSPRGQRARERALVHGAEGQGVPPQRPIVTVKAHEARGAEGHADHHRQVRFQRRRFGRVRRRRSVRLDRGRRADARAGGLRERAPDLGRGEEERDDQEARGAGGGDRGGDEVAAGHRRVHRGRIHLHPPVEAAGSVMLNDIRLGDFISRG